MDLSLVTLFPARSFLQFDTGEEMERARKEEEARQKRDWQTRAAAVGVSLTGSFPFATAELEVQLSLPTHCATV